MRSRCNLVAQRRSVLGSEGEWDPDLLELITLARISLQKPVKALNVDPLEMTLYAMAFAVNSVIMLGWWLL